MKYRTKFLGDNDSILAHLTELDELDKHCFPIDDIYHKIKGEKYGKRGNHIWWLTYDVNTKEPVAFAGLKVYLNTKNVYFCRAGVHKSHRRKGLHHILLDKRMNWCFENDIKYAYSYTSNENYVSVNNLIDVGFRLCGPWFTTAGSFDEFIFTCKQIT